jgi:hyperosmotically inducible periplasmic protein
MQEVTTKSAPGTGRSIAMNLGKGVRTLLIGSLLASGTLLVAQQPATQDAPPSADNTKVNQRDQNANEPTADQQKDNHSDRDITQQIRQAIMKDKSLSTYAHNVKIITQDGQVTLKGPVRSDDEKKAIEAKATEIAGQNKVSNELEVKPKE